MTMTKKLSKNLHNQTLIHSEPTQNLSLFHFPSQKPSQNPPKTLKPCIILPSPLMALLSHHNPKPLNPKPHFPSLKPKTPTLHFAPPQPIPSLHVTSATSLTSSPSASQNPDSTIQSLCLAGQLKEAISLFESSPTHQFEEKTYQSLIHLCRQKRAVQEGYRVHTRLTQSETLFSLYVGNLLLLMHVKFEKLLTAWTVFAKMRERDTFSWNIMISGYGQLGFLEDSLDLYQRMIWDGFRPALHSFATVLRCCGGLKDLRRGKEVHAHVFRFQLGFEIGVSNALVTMYSKCKDLGSARKVFDEMPKRDCVSWSAMISGYLENYKNALGIELFLEMLSLSVEPNLFTMTSVISRSDWKLGRNLHGYAIKKRFCADSTVCNSLITMYSNSGQLENATKIFSKMSEKDLISWTAMISGFEQNGFSIQALEILSQMESSDIIPGYVTIISALNACAKLGNLDKGTELHKLARIMGLEPDRKISNALLELYAKTRSIDRAMEVFKKVPKKDVILFTTIISGFQVNKRNLDSLNFFRVMQKYVEPNHVTFMAALSACTDLGAVSCGKEIHARVLKLGLGFSEKLSNSILNLYAKCGKMKLATSQFYFMNLKHDIVSWNILINGYAALEKADQAEELFNRTVEIARLKPDDVTFVALLRAFSRAGMVDKGKKYFYKMVPKYSIIPNLKHYACMVDLLGRAGLLNEALDLIQNMGLKPDSAIWGALLNACRIHKNLEMGEFAAKYLFELEDGDYLGYYVLYCKFYAELGFWERVDRVRKSMREKGLETNPGCSWVEIKGVLHAFLSNDKSHPQINEINGVLKGLEERIRISGLDPFDLVEKSKEAVLCGHSERLAIGFGLIKSLPGRPVSVTKNLYMCGLCHEFVKNVSKIVRREISVRDVERLHRFRNGECCCGE